MGVIDALVIMKMEPENFVDKEKSIALFEEATEVLRKRFKELLDRKD